MTESGLVSPAAAAAVLPVVLRVLEPVLRLHERRCS